MLHYLRASLGRMFSEHRLRTSIGRMLNERRKTIFFRAETKFGPTPLSSRTPRPMISVPEEKLDQVVANHPSLMTTLFKRRGIRFIFVPIPEEREYFLSVSGNPEACLLGTAGCSIATVRG